MPRVVPRSISPPRTSVSSDNPKVEIVDRRRPAFLAHDAREVRRDHVGPARSVGERRSGALYTREFLALVKSRLNPRRRRHRVRAALREHGGSRAQRDRDVLRRFPERRACSRTRRKAWVTTPCCSGEPATRRSTSTACTGGCAAPSTRPSPARWPMWVLPPPSICSPPTQAARKIFVRGSRRRHQHRSQSKAAVSRGRRAQRESRRRHPPTHHGGRGVSRRLVRGLAGALGAVAGKTCAHDGGSGKGVLSVPVAAGGGAVRHGVGFHLRPFASSLKCVLV